MLPSSIKGLFPALVLFFNIFYVFAQDRQIIAKFNPGCTSCSTDTTLVHVTAKGSSDIIHQIWDFTQGRPTIIFLLGSVNSTLTITWNETIPYDFVMNEKPSYSFAIALDKLYEYDDVADVGQIDDKSKKNISLSLDRFKWNLTSSEQTNQRVMVELQGKNSSFHRHHKHGVINVKLELIAFKDYAVELPHLIHTANSTLIDVSLVNLTAHFNASRYAWHATLVSTDNATSSMVKNITKSLDDEHTPGVFEIIEIRTPESVSGGDGGYVMFRPVGYTAPARGVAASTLAHVSDISRARLLPGTTLNNFYLKYPKDKLLVQDVFVSFGEAGDGYYKQHNFTAWSFAVGYGSPPSEGFSLFVILVISIGLGVPVLLAVSGVTFVMMRRMRARRNPPTRLID